VRRKKDLQRRHEFLSLPSVVAPRRRVRGAHAQGSLQCGRAGHQRSQVTHLFRAMQRQDGVPAMNTHSTAISACEKGQQCRQASRSYERRGTRSSCRKGSRTTRSSVRVRRAVKAVRLFTTGRVSLSGCALQGMVRGAARCASCLASALGSTYQQSPRRRARRSRASEGSEWTGHHRCSAGRATVARSTAGTVKGAVRCRGRSRSPRRAIPSWSTGCARRRLR